MKLQRFRILSRRGTSAISDSFTGGNFSVFGYSLQHFRILSAAGPRFRCRNCPEKVRFSARKVDVRLPGKGDSNSHEAWPVYRTITMIKWFQTSRLSTKNSLSGSAIPVWGTNSCSSRIFLHASNPTFSIFPFSQQMHVAMEQLQVLREFALQQEPLHLLNSYVCVCVCV